MPDSADAGSDMGDLLVLGSASAQSAITDGAMGDSIQQKACSAKEPPQRVTSRPLAPRRPCARCPRWNLLRGGVSVVVPSAPTRVLRPRALARTPACMAASQVSARLGAVPHDSTVAPPMCY